MLNRYNIIIIPNSEGIKVAKCSLEKSETKNALTMLITTFLALILTSLWSTSKEKI